MCKANTYNDTYIIQLRISCFYLVTYLTLIGAAKLLGTFNLANFSITILSRLQVTYYCPQLGFYLLYTGCVRSKEWHGSENQPHSRSSPYISLPSPPHPHTFDYRPHPIPTNHIPVPTPSPFPLTRALKCEIYKYVSCNMYLCTNKNFTLVVTVLYKMLFWKIKSSNGSSIKHKQPGKQWSR